MAFLGDSFPTQFSFSGKETELSGDKAESPSVVWAFVLGWKGSRLTQEASR